MPVDPNDPFLTRDWGAVAEAKTRRRLAERAKRGAIDGIRIGAELRAHVRLLRPEWPTAQSRAADLEHHQLLASRLRVDL